MDCSTLNLCFSKKHAIILWIFCDRSASCTLQHQISVVSLRQNTPIFSEFSDRSSSCTLQNKTSVTLPKQSNIHWILWQILLLYASTPDQCFLAKTLQFSLNFLTDLTLVGFNTRAIIFAKTHANFLWIFCDRSSSCTLQHITSVSSPNHANFLWIFCDRSSSCSFQHQTCDFRQNTTIFFEFSMTNLPIVRFITRPVSLRQNTPIFSKYSVTCLSLVRFNTRPVIFAKTRQ